MAKLGFILRSGGASGADEAFEQGVDEYAATLGSDPYLFKEIYLPWEGFRKNRSPLYGSCKRSRLLAKEFHPNWANVSPAGRDFHGRNCYQILGKNLDRPSSFVLCWTQDGAITGGTGQALRIAQEYNVPILNFASHDDQFISDYILEQAERIRG